MQNDKRTALATVYRALAALMCAVGVALTCGLFEGTPDPKLLCYFTIQSNLLCLFLWLALIARPALSERIRGGVTLAILLTMTIYHFLLSGDYGFSSWQAAGNVMVHYCVPCAMLLDFALFGKRGRLRAFDPLLWAIYPLCYFVFAMILGASGVVVRGDSSYVYPFLDASVLSAGEIARNVALIAVGYVACGYLVYGIDRLLSRERGGAWASHGV